MAKANIDMLSSILKYIDINYMTDEECNSIYELDINNKKNQEDIIARLIVYGVKTEYSEEAFNRAREVIRLGIDNIESATEIFQQMSFPFENDIDDKKAFLEIIYKELFGERDNNQIECIADFLFSIKDMSLIFNHDREVVSEKQDDILRSYIRES